MSLKFRPGITTSSPASRDPLAQYRLWRGLIPAITHSLHPSLTDHTQTRRPNPKLNFHDNNINNCRPNPIPSITDQYKGRPPLTLTRRTDSQRKALKRKIRYLHKPIPPSTPNPRCARLQIWYKDARKRRREIKAKAELTRQIEEAFPDHTERALVLFRTIAGLHRISVVDPALTPFLPLSRPRTLPVHATPKLRTHIGPLTPHGNFFSINDPP